MRIKNIIKKTAAAVALSAILFTLGASADGTVIDTGADPLVTLSYITNVLRPDITAELSDKAAELSIRAAELSDKTAALENKTAALENKIDTATSEIKTALEYEVVYLTQGQALMAEGPLELILRAGECSAIVYLEENVSNGVGLSDLTSASEILNGTPLGRNHYIIIPRADGRGVYITSSDAYIMVRGEYKIVT